MKIYNLKLNFVVITTFFLNAGAAFAQFTVYTPPVAIAISDIEYSTALSRVILATDSGVFFFDGNTWAQTTTADGLPSNDVKCLAVTSSGGVLTATANGLAKWTGVAWIPYTLNTSQTYSYISAIYVDPGVDTIYGTNNGKLLMKKTAATATNIGFSPAVGLFTDIGEMNIPGPYDFIFSTSTNGAVIYDLPSTGTFVVTTSSTPIPSNNILSHTIEGNKTYDGTDQGVYIPDFTNFPSTPSVIYNTSNSPLPSNIIQAVAVRNGVEWYGTPNGLAKHANSSWTIYNTGNSNLPINNVVELEYDSLGNILWIATADGKLSKLDLANSISETAIPQTDINIFPNPSSADIFINPGASELYSIEVINPLGQSVLKKRISNSNNIVSVQKIPGGFYMVEITLTTGARLTRKLHVTKM